MKRKCLVFILAILISLMVVFPVPAAESPVTVRWNDQAIKFEVAPVVDNGQCLVPLRPVMEAMGSKIDWNQATSAVTACLPGVTFTVAPGSPVASVNGREISLPVAPAIRDGVVVVPLRAIADICNIRIDWDSTTSVVTLYRNEVDLDYGSDRETVHQVSMLSALLEGQYDGQTSFGELKKYGDTGIGTFEGLDGEMVELDGKFYQVKADGVAYPVADTMKTPFASVTYFEADKSQAVNEEINFEQLQNRVDSMISNKNIFYAIKVTGDFKYVKTRSVPGQQKPYPPLAEVTKNQPTFEFNNVKGTLVGFWCPSYVDGMNVPGYHVHFLNADKNAGGHLLGFTMESGQIDIDTTPNFYMCLPSNEEFGKIDMTEDRSQETNKVEK
ncbi:MAG: acetolactate decarboxylase [Syntrophomonas sp.]|nr:acetolactate decarboxylase [Syntrophomonas sp.]